jgi:hypothetical protein
VYKYVTSDNWKEYFSTQDSLENQLVTNQPSNPTWGHPIWNYHLPE